MKYKNREIFNPQKKEFFCENKNQKAQAALEFILVFAIMTLFATLFFIMIFADTSQGRLKNDQETVDDMANFLQQELITAEKVEDGYIRNFTLPEKIGGKDYSIYDGEYMLIVNMGKVSSVKGIPKVRGNFTINAMNTIVKNSTTPYIWIN